MDLGRRPKIRGVLKSHWVSMLKSLTRIWAIWDTPHFPETSAGKALAPSSRSADTVEPINLPNSW
jgi:hypothetical protein